MPITDLQPTTPGLKRGGVIRLGYMAETTEGVKYPVAAKHFVLVDAPELIEFYGEQPTELNILLPFATVNENLDAWHKHRIASALTCQGDGVNIVYKMEATTGKIEVRDGKAVKDFMDNGRQFKPGETVPCSGMNHHLYTRCQQCRPQMILKAMIPETGRFVYYQVSTGSIYNITLLTQQLNYFAADRPMGLGIKDLKGIPFKLRLSPREISVPNMDKAGKPKVNRETGKPQPRIRKEMWLLSLEIDPDWVRRMMQVQVLLAAPEQRFGLPAQASPADDDIYDAEPLDHDQVVIDSDGVVTELIPASAPVPPPLFDEPAPVPPLPAIGQAAPGPANQPAAAPTTNGGPTNGEVYKQLLAYRDANKVNIEKALVAMVNNRVLATYENEHHLRQAIGLARWPKQNDQPGWTDAYNQAIAHARAKEGQPPEQVTPLSLFGDVQ